MERQYTAWNGVIPGPFYRGILSLIVVYCGISLSFSTQVGMFTAAACNLGGLSTVYMYILPYWKYDVGSCVIFHDLPRISKVEVLYTFTRILPTVPMNLP